MLMCWVYAGIAEAERSFRKVRVARDIRYLIARIEDIKQNRDDSEDLYIYFSLG